MRTGLPSERCPSGDALKDQAGTRLGANQIERSQREPDARDLSLRDGAVPPSPSEISVLMDNQSDIPAVEAEGSPDRAVEVKKYRRISEEESSETAVDRVVFAPS